MNINNDDTDVDENDEYDEYDNMMTKIRVIEMYTSV